MPRHDFELNDPASVRARAAGDFADARVSVDLCARCAAQKSFPKLMGKLKIAPGNLLEIVRDVDHPPYEDWGDYNCDNCGKKLTEEDN